MSINLELGLQQKMQRDLTRWFISTDPTSITLTPRQWVEKPGGGFDFVDVAPRPEQTFKIIQQGGHFNGITDSGDGFERQYEFILLGEWDCEMDIGDWWKDPNGQHWEVSGFIPYNGYERKAGIYSFGSYPRHG